MALHTPLQIAEGVKKRYGNLINNSADVIELPVIGDEENKNEVSLEIVHSVILARVEEALMLLAKSIDKSLLKEQIGSGVILTGGMTKLKGIRELAQAIFDGMPVRIAQPEDKDIGGLFEELKDPSFSTVIGLLLYAAGKHTEYEININNELLHSKHTQTDDLVEIQKIDRLKGEKKTDLGNIELKETIKAAKTKRDREETKRREKTDKPVKSENEEFIFEDLPTDPSEGVNPIKKLANWARQLF
jgi:cell division protein FtsA